MNRYSFFLCITFLASACSNSGSNTGESEDSESAVILSVEVTGQELGYNFAVTVSSPDLDCEQYSDWWEILSEDGKLIHRSVIEQSHPNEQPFERSSGGINIKANQKVIIRAHMNNLGYGTQALKGSVKAGFQEIQIDKNFAQAVEKQAPQPPKCE
ncbi:MAG: hypothetical protein NW226_25325 [Microscillaceae bacterium]|nr:hypothetical protein [Microscillaceae bacterium]